MGGQEVQGDQSGGYWSRTKNLLKNLDRKWGGYGDGEK